MILRIATEVSKAHKPRILLAFRHFEELIRLPELSEWRQRHALRSPTLAGNLVKRFQPLQIGFALGETLPTARFPHFTQVGKDIKIIPRFIPGSHDALHRHHMLITVIPRHGEIVTLERGRGGQNDIGMFR